MLRLFKVICLVCFLLVPLTAFTVEDVAFEVADYFPADYKCYDTGKQSFFLCFSICVNHNFFSFLARFSVFFVLCERKCSFQFHSGIKPKVVFIVCAPVHISHFV